MTGAPSAGSGLQVSTVTTNGETYVIAGGVASRVDGQAGGSTAAAPTSSSAASSQGTESTGLPTPTTATVVASPTDVFGSTLYVNYTLPITNGNTPNGLTETLIIGTTTDSAGSVIGFTSTMSGAASSTAAA